MEFQDPRGRKETLVSSIKKKPHQENLENQGVLDLEEQKENQEVQVPKNSCSLFFNFRHTMMSLFKDISYQ